MQNGRIIHPTYRILGPCAGTCPQAYVVSPHASHAAPNRGRRIWRPLQCGRSIRCPRALPPTLRLPLRCKCGTPSPSLITSSFSPYPMYHHVTVGDGSFVPISTSGHVSLPSFFSNRPFHILDVLVTPRIIKNLVHVH